jgi:hypothetical protein
VRPGGRVAWLWFQSECVSDLQTAMCSRARNCTTRPWWSRPVKYGPRRMALETNALPAGVVVVGTRSPMLLWMSSVEVGEVGDERGVDFSGDVALEASDDVFGREALGGASSHVGAGAGVVA